MSHLHSRQTWGPALGLNNPGNFDRIYLAPDSNLVTSGRQTVSAVWTSRMTGPASRSPTETKSQEGAVAADESSQVPQRYKPEQAVVSISRNKLIRERSRPIFAPTRRALTVLAESLDSLYRTPQYSCPCNLIY